MNIMRFHCYHEIKSENYKNLKHTTSFLATDDYS